MTTTTWTLGPDHGGPVNVLRGGVIWYSFPNREAAEAYLAIVDPEGD